MICNLKCDMATVSLDFIKNDVTAAMREAVTGVTIKVVMAGGDRWETPGSAGSKQRDFKVVLES